MATLQFSEGSDIPVPLHQSKQLLNNIIDGMANVRPSSLWMEVPLSPTSYEAGYRKINYGMLASAINGVAWWLEKELGRGENFETLTYVGPNDFRSIPMLLGAVKAGYKVRLLLSTGKPFVYRPQATSCVPTQHYRRVYQSFR